MLLKTLSENEFLHSLQSSSSQFMIMSGESRWVAWLFWRFLRLWFAISVPCTMKSLMVLMLDSWMALFLLMAFWNCTQNGGSFLADRLTFGARVFTLGCKLRLQIMSGVFWLSGDDGSELIVCGDKLLEIGESEQKFMSGANFDRQFSRKIKSLEILVKFLWFCWIFDQPKTLFQDSGIEEMWTSSPLRFDKN